MLGFTQSRVGEFKHTPAPMQVAPLGHGGEAQPAHPPVLGFAQSRVGEFEFKRTPAPMQVVPQGQGGEAQRARPVLGLLPHQPQAVAGHLLWQVGIRFRASDTALQNGLCCVKGLCYM